MKTLILGTLFSLNLTAATYECAGEGNQLRYDGQTLVGQVGDRTKFRNPTATTSALGTDISASTTACGDECPAQVHLTLPQVYLGATPAEFDTFIVLRERNLPTCTPKTTWVVDRYHVFPTHCRATNP